MEKINLSGVSETLFVPLYARAIESKKKNPRFVDKIAVEIVDSVDYDFEGKIHSKMNINGCIGRTVIFDREVKKFIDENPFCTVINMGAGLDDRFSRMDEGTIKWYNIDVESVVDLRNKIIKNNSREKNIAASILDKKWIDEIEKKDNVLVIAEGLLMYFEENDVRQLIKTILNSFKKCTLICELMTKWSVEHQKVHETVNTMDVVFKWGIEQSKDVEKIDPRFEMYGEYNITDEMRKLSPIFITIVSPFLRDKNNRVACFKKSNIHKIDLNAAFTIKK